MFWILVIVVVIIIVKKNSGNQKSYPQTRESDVVKLSLAVNSPREFFSVLNDLQRITETTVLRNYTGIRVVVQVHKIDSTYCCINFSMLADGVFRNVTAGEGIEFNGDDQISFKTNLATSFTTPDDVKREILLQFNWSDIILISDAECKMYTEGDFTSTPLVCYSFTAKKRL